MKTKIFLAFVVIIFVALLSSFIFEWLIIKDFDNYVRGIKEDQFYWIAASVEDSYSDGKWDIKALSESIHWAMMLGMDIMVIDSQGAEIISSRDAMSDLTETMRHRMEDLFHIHHTEGDYDKHPLYIKGNSIGTLLFRPFQKEQIQEKEFIFKKRTKNFLYVSLLIAGGGLLIAAMLLSQYLTKPLTSLKEAAERISRGDFNVQTSIDSKDEVGKLSESFDKMSESLQKEEELRKRLMSNIAHELRTPLTIAKTHIEAIEDGILEDTAKGLENVKNEINRLIRLVKGIEDITSAEASFFLKKDLVEINLPEFLKGVVRELTPAFIEKGLYIEIETKNDLLILTDIEKLEKIVRNLISNSLKFTVEGGVLINYGIHDINFFIEIKDTGKGIPQKELPFIFNRFYRGEQSGAEGLGLGLAIVKELTEVMGGTIRVQSETGKGTMFRVDIPVIMSATDK